MALSSSALAHSILDSSSSAFAINSSLTITLRRGARKNIVDAQRRSLPPAAAWS
jgi:hypothetical protein